MKYTNRVSTMSYHIPTPVDASFMKRVAAVKEQLKIQYHINHGNFQALQPNEDNIKKNHFQNSNESIEWAYKTGKISKKTYNELKKRNQAGNKAKHIW